MSKSPTKTLMLFLLIIFLIRSDIFCSTSQKASIPENKRMLPEIRKVDSLNDLANKVSVSSIKLSLDYAQQALYLAKSIHYLKGEGEALYHTAQYYFSNVHLAKSLELYFEVLKIGDQGNDIKLETNALGKISQIFTEMKRIDKAKFYLGKSFSLAMNNKDTNKVVELLIQSCDIHKLDKAPEKAKVDLYQALWYSNKLNDPNVNLWVYKHIGSYYLSVNDFQSAEYYYRKAIKLSLGNNYLYELGSLYSLMSQICLLKNNLNDALIYNKMALDIRQQTQQEFQIASSLLNIGNSYMLMNMPDSSLIYLKKGLDLADKLNINILQVQGNMHFYKWYLQRRDWKNALEYYRSYEEAKDSLAFKQKREDIAILEANHFIFETEKKSELLSAENQTQKIQINYNRIQIVFLGIILFLVFLALYFTYRRSINNKKSLIAFQQLNEKLDIEIKERKQIEDDLRKSEILHHFLTDNSLDTISRIDKKGKFVYVSPSCSKIFGYDQKEMLELDDAYATLDVSSIATFKIIFRDMLHTKEPAKFTLKTRKKDGSLFWTESYVNPIFDPKSGELIETIVITRDVSARIAHEDALKENARQKEILMREIHHRARNNFAILISLIGLQKFKTQNPGVLNILSDLQARIHTMVLIHEQLFRSNSINTVAFDKYIINLTENIARTFKKEGITLHPEISECNLNIETALPLGLIVNELMTNSFKYAFNGRSTGKIYIKLAPVVNDTEDKIKNWELIVKDDGIGLHESFSFNNASSMGSQIIQLLVEQLNARINYTGNEGAFFRIVFPETTNI